MISNLISRRSPSAVASATVGSCIAPTPTRVKTSQTYYHRNQQYSIVGLTNAAGTLVERYTYSDYGTLGIHAANGTVRSSSTYANRYTYTGREWDADLRLYHFLARWYDPATGGFVSRDPLGYVDGMSLYRGYFGVRGVDADGLDDWVDHCVAEYIARDMQAIVKEKCRGQSPTTPDTFVSYQSKLEATYPETVRVASEITINYCNAFLSRSVTHTGITDPLDSSRHGDCKINIPCENSERTRALGGISTTHQLVIVCPTNPPLELPHSHDAVDHELIHANQPCRSVINGTVETRKSYSEFDHPRVLKRETEAYYCDENCGQNTGSSNAAQDCLLRELDSAYESYYLEELNYFVANKAIRRFATHHKAGSLYRFPEMPNRG